MRHRKKVLYMKLLKILLIIIASVIGLVLVAAIALAIAVHDTTDNTIPAVREADADLETVIHREAVESLDNAPEKDDITLLLDEYAMNEVLYAVTQELDIPMVEMRGAYAAYGEDGALSVEIPIRAAGIFQTCIKGTLKVTYEENVLTATVEQAKVGKFSCTSGIIRTFVLNSSNQKKFQKALSDADIKGTLDLRNLSVSMTADELSDTVTALTKDDPNTLLYALLCDLCLKSPDMLEFSFGENRLYGVTLHASRLAYDSATDGALSYPLDLDSARASTLALSENGLTRKNVSSVFHYYTSGYETLGDEDKAKVDALGLTDNGKGVRNVSELTMAQVLLNQSGGLAASILNHAVTFTVTEHQMNTIFAGLDVIGTGVAFYSDSKVAYLALEDIDIALGNYALDVTVVLNLNGKRICGHVSTDCPDTNRMALDAQITELRLGSEVMNEKRTSLFLQYLDTVLESQNWISANAETSTLTLDLGAALEGQSEFATLLGLSSTLDMQCREVGGEGQIQLVFHIF